MAFVSNSDRLTIKDGPGWEPWESVTVRKLNIGQRDRLNDEIATVTQELSDSDLESGNVTKAQLKTVQLPYLMKIIVDWTFTLEDRDPDDSDDPGQIAEVSYENIRQLDPNYVDHIMSEWREWSNPEEEAAERESFPAEG